MAAIPTLAPVSNAPAAAAPPPLDLSRPSFTEPLAERVQWAVDQGLSEALIEVHPAELGALRIRVRLEGDVAQVDLGAANAHTRELLRASLGELRALLGARGLSLAPTQVVGLSGVAQSRGPERAVTATGAGHAPADRRRPVRIGLLDDYA